MCAAGRARSRRSERTSSRAPEPSTPTSATISPLRDAQVDVRELALGRASSLAQARRAVLARASAAGARRPLLLGARARPGRPRARAAMPVLRSGPRQRASRCTIPSRMTATRSAVARPARRGGGMTSMTTRPASARPCMRRKSSVGLLLRERRVRLVEEEDARVDAPAPARSRCAGGPRAGTPRGARRRASSDGQVVEQPSLLGHRPGGERARASRPTMRFWPTVRLGKSCGSWWTTATRSRRATGTERLAIEDAARPRPHGSRRRGS